MNSLSTRLNNKLGVVLLMFVSISISLLIGEFIVRTYFPQRLYFNITQWDQYLGFTLIPGITGYSKTEDFEMYVKINSHGLRDRNFNFQKNPNAYRIGIFGDSFTFGEGVQDNETYPKILENLFRSNVPKDTTKQIEVINFGIGKTATSHQFALYQKVGYKYDLDLVIVGFLSGNDFNENWSGLFNLKNGNLIHVPSAYSSVRKIQKYVYRIPFYRWLATHSHIANLARKTVTILNDKWRFNSATKHKGQPTISELTKKQTLLTSRIFKEFDLTVKNNGSEFVVVNLPAKSHKPKDKYGTETPPIYVEQNEELQQSLKKNGILVIDLVPVISVLSPHKIYFPNDGHMTKYGHQIIAKEIFKKIKLTIF